MTDAEFQGWFIAHLDAMASLGICHYNAERAKEVRALLTIMEPQMRALDRRIAALENAGFLPTAEPKKVRSKRRGR